MRRIAARVTQAKKPSARNPTAATCVLYGLFVDDATDAFTPGAIDAARHTLEMTRKTGFTPMRSSKYRHEAANNDVSAASVTKHLPAASQDANGPQGRPNNVITGGRIPVIPALIP